MREKIKIIIADDFELLREDMTEIINEQPDMEVIATAEDGKEVVDYAEKMDYDIILMDIEMESTISGIIATEIIREKNKQAKIIFLTAHETDQMVLSAMGTGAVDYIIKGSPDKEIINHIRSAYNGNPIMEGQVQKIIMKEYKRLQMSEKALVFFINNISTLTPAEKEIIGLLLKDMTVREIAKARGVEMVTIKTQITKLLQKLGARRTKEIIKRIRDLNLTHLF